MQQSIAGAFHPRQHSCLFVRLCALALCLAFAPVYAATNAPELSVNNSVATAGFYRLSWKTDVHQVELQADTSEQFTHPSTIYTGSDTASVISGKPNGTWFYRVRNLGNQGPGPWSKPVQVTVAHHSLVRAFSFLGVGILVFLATVIMILRGPRDS